jgi:catechol-2,3-dioxygenase
LASNSWKINSQNSKIDPMALSVENLVPEHQRLSLIGSLKALIISKYIPLHSLKSSNSETFTAKPLGF